MSQPKVSIIVPIYGVEKYLHQCVDSILAQTLKEIEIILVDDGSKDNCPAIVDEYAKKDPRVVPIHQENGGYGRAVNHGIEIATGEYIGIIESDDWIEPDMYEKLYKKAIKTNADVTKSGFYVYNSFLSQEHQNKIWEPKYQDLNNAPDTVFTAEEYPLIITFHASIWSSLYKADFVKQIPLIETRSASYQDFPFMIEVMCRATRIAVVKEPLVHYRMEEGQNSSTIRRDERLLLMVTQCINCKKILQKYKKYEILKEEFYLHTFFANYTFFRTIYWKHKKAYLKKLKELYRDVDLESFKKNYFSSYEKRIISCWKKGALIPSLYDRKSVRRFLGSIHISRNGFCIQLLGVQISKNIKDRPAIIKIKL